MSKSKGKMWGGRFSKVTADLVDRFNASIAFDSRLWEYDIQGSIAHARMLGKCGIIPQPDSEKIIRGLKDIAKDIESGSIKFDVSTEDIHMNIEKLLRERIGDTAGKLHTARSRNDQVALDLRLYLKHQIGNIDSAIKDLQRIIVDLAEQHLETIMPGYTHLQHAQPVTLAHHFLAYFQMLQRDRERLSDCLHRVDVMPLGSGAIAGTSFPIDREFAAKELGFSSISENSMDAVSDRDFIAEFLSVGAILGMHMSRLAEEIVIWNTAEFGFVELDDSVATGSSLMPQKKNPDVAELIRGKTGRLFGNLMAMLTVLKALPLTYNKDLQEDKQLLFDTVDTLLQTLPVLGLLLEQTEFKSQRLKEVLYGDFSTATDLADYLVRQGEPFRVAHETVGKIVSYCIQKGKKLEDLTAVELRSFSSLFGESVPEVNPKDSIEARNIPGGTSSVQVTAQLKKARKTLD